MQKAKEGYEYIPRRKSECIMVRILDRKVLEKVAICDFFTESDPPDLREAWADLSEFITRIDTLKTDILLCHRSATDFKVAYSYGSFYLRYYRDPVPDELEIIDAYFSAKEKKRIGKEARKHEKDAKILARLRAEYGQDLTDLIQD